MNAQLSFWTALTEGFAEANQQVAAFNINAAQQLMDSYQSNMAHVVSAFEPMQNIPMDWLNRGTATMGMEGTVLAQKGVAATKPDRDNKADSEHHGNENSVPHNTTEPSPLVEKLIASVIDQGNDSRS